MSVSSEYFVELKLLCTSSRTQQIGTNVLVYWSQLLCSDWCCVQFVLSRLFAGFVMLSQSTVLTLSSNCCARFLFVEFFVLRFFELRLLFLFCLCWGFLPRIDDGQGLLAFLLAEFAEPKWLCSFSFCWGFMCLVSLTRIIVLVLFAEIFFLRLTFVLFGLLCWFGWSQIAVAMLAFSAIRAIRTILAISAFVAMLTMSAMAVIATIAEIAEIVGIAEIARILDDLSDPDDFSDPNDLSLSDLRESVALSDHGDAWRSERSQRTQRC